MGKSDKKVKSDRINALKKQYDAYLEEDKKRKERNEYILARMHDMRLSGSVVPVTRKPHVSIDDQHIASYNRPTQRLNRFPAEGVHNYPNPPQASTDIAPFSTKTIGETFLLNELGKKYILIPKLLTVNDYDSHESYNVNSKENDNADWKSKYDILNQLKKDEKEPSIDTLTRKEVQFLNTEQDPFSRNDSQQNIGEVFESNKELPVKDIPNNKSVFGIHIENNEKELQIIEKDDLPEYKEKASTDINVNNYETEDTNLGLYDTELITNEPVNVDYNNVVPEYDNTMINKEYSNDDNTKYADNDNPILRNDYDKYSEHVMYEQYEPKEEKDEDTKETVYPEENNMKPIDVITAASGDFMKSTNDEALLREDNENIQYPIDPMRTQDYTPHADVILQDGVNINPEGIAIDQGSIEPTYHYDQTEAVPENTENVDNAPIDTSQMEAFEAEQREMFYQEPNPENIAYDQENLGDTNTNNENYEDQYNAYYEGAQQEYPVEVNEHEETDQRYDPSYEQQYVDNYSYEQPEYEQLPQGFEQQLEGYDEQAGYDPSMASHVEAGEEHEPYQYEVAEHETPEQIQQQLDNEQEFIETQKEQMVPLEHEDKPVAPLTDV